MMPQPIFKSIFGADWERLPPVMHKHYANLAYTSQVSVAEGTMEIRRSRLAKILSPVFRAAGTLVPRDGMNIPVAVRFISRADADTFELERHFHFPDKEYVFHSRMKPVGGNELVEFMRFGLGWRFACRWTGEKILLQHKGYGLSLFGRLVPLPLGLLLGAGNAEETPLDNDRFAMHMDIRHPLWGEVYRYCGVFRMVEAT